MNQTPLIELAVSSDHKVINGRQDQECVLALEIAPKRSLRSIARQRSARPHIGYGLDVSGSMNLVTDDPSELVDVGSEVRDGQLYTLVSRADGSAPRTLMDDMFEAAEESLSALKDDDQISVFHFSTEVSSVQTTTGAQRDQVVNLIRRGAELNHESTNMSAALERALATLTQDKERPATLVLFTDGMPDSGTEAQVLESARRCALASVPVHVCAFGDQLSLDFLNEISSITGGNITLGRNRDELLRQFRDVVKDAQETGLVHLNLELNFDPSFVPEEIFRGKPQSQLLRRLKPGQRRVTIPLGNLNAGSWQSIYVKGRLLGSGSTEGRQSIASISLSYRQPSESQAREVKATYSIPLGETSRVDREIRELVEMTLLKSVERDFHRSVQSQNWEQAKSLAAQLLGGYEELGSAEGDQNAQHIRAIIKSLSTRGVIDLAEIQRLANSASDSSTTSSQSERFGDGSSTNIARSMSDSETRAGDAGEETRGEARAHSKRRREVIDFDI